MLLFASSRGSWLLSLAVLALGCTGIREEPTPGEATPIIFSSQSGGSAAGGNGPIGGAGSGGGVPLLVFADCACASIIEGTPPALCDDCVQQATSDPTDACFVLLEDCDNDPDCFLARDQLDGNTCAGDPQCTAMALTGLLDSESGALLFALYDCLCSGCAECNPNGGAGGGGPVGGGGTVADSCTVSPQ